MSYALEGDGFWGEWRARKNRPCNLGRFQGQQCFLKQKNILWFHFAVRLRVGCWCCSSNPPPPPCAGDGALGRECQSSLCSMTRDCLVTQSCILKPFYFWSGQQDLCSWPLLLDFQVSDGLKVHCEPSPESLQLTSCAVRRSFLPVSYFAGLQPMEMLFLVSLCPFSLQEASPHGTWWHTSISGAGAAQTCG